MNVYDLICRQLALEGIGIDDDGQLIRVPCPNPDTLHRVYVARYLGDITIFFQAELQATVRSSLLCLPVTEFFENPQRGSNTSVAVFSQRLLNMHSVTFAI